MSELDETPPVLAPVDVLRAEASAWAVANPPSRLAATAFLGVLSAIGFIIGGTIRVITAAFRFCALAFTYGYRKGANVQVVDKAARRRAQQPPQPVNYAHKG